MYSVLIVDDSATARLALKRAIEQDPELYVAGEADCGAEALAMVRRYHPAVVTMDVVMRRESGIDVAAEIMAKHPCPIVIVTARDASDPKLAYQALQVGALEVVPKLPGPLEVDYQSRVASFTRLLRNAARIPVVTRRQREPPASVVNVARPGPRPMPRLVVLGASTGGPALVREILAAIPPNQPVPIALAQHIARGFGAGFAEWLGEATGHRTFYVNRRVELRPGLVYVAPDDADLIVETGLRGNVSACKSALGTPSVDALFQSAAAVIGPAVTAVLMTGMGSDGARGVQALAQAGATIIVQDPTTCTVTSMPEAALRAAPGSTVLAPPAIAEALRRLLRVEGMPAA
jgi:two-component system chemotaxis response regulator CheB